ncbi:hypothetical protein B0H67DRAFT_157037 [Lasiosphaeris hirsuta]|uniref:Uncharacterized protein n=1 Tax=Lasiosphaeris hirsuta TaxID=260670 RepID=A0AA40DX39_9PEZI|nr:hypothetical protein B0H67DRAFT_157037 [Lasiosphaeris hirsuta]
MRKHASTTSTSLCKIVKIGIRDVKHQYGVIERIHSSIKWRVSFVYVNGTFGVMLCNRYSFACYEYLLHIRFLCLLRLYDFVAIAPRREYVTNACYAPTCRDHMALLQAPVARTYSLWAVTAAWPCQLSRVSRKIDLTTRNYSWCSGISGILQSLAKSLPPWCCARHSKNCGCTVALG